MMPLTRLSLAELIEYALSSLAVPKNPSWDKAPRKSCRSVVMSRTVVALMKFWT